MKSEHEKPNEGENQEARIAEQPKGELIIKLVFEFPGLSLFPPNYYNPYMNGLSGFPQLCPHSGYSNLLTHNGQSINSQFSHFPVPFNPQPNFAASGNFIQQNQQIPSFPRETYNPQKCPYDNPLSNPIRENKVSQGTNTDFNDAMESSQVMEQFHEKIPNLSKIINYSKIHVDKDFLDTSKMTRPNFQLPNKHFRNESDQFEEDPKHQQPMANENSEVGSKLDFSDNQFSDDDDNSGNFDDKTAEIRLTHFDNLNKLLILIFSGVEITEKEWNLTKMEEKILNSVLKRKFYNKVQNDGIQLDETNKFNFINQLAKISTLKRPKDCYKMLLSRLFRILKQNYFEKNKFSNQNVYLFYQHYFGDLAKKENIPIQSFFYPFERNNKFISLFPKISHHLNFRYYERIFKSDKFAADIKTVLNKVYSDHFSELKFKFSTLLKKWERFFFNFDNDDAMVEKTILKYLQFNNRCKIPFTVSEIENSIALFERMISKFEN